MKNISYNVTQKIRLRKFLMFVFSISFIILICGILNNILEDGNANVNSVRMISNDKNIPVLDTAVLQKQNPREIHHEKTDKKIRLYFALSMIILIFGSIIADLIFVRCPCCSKHLTHAVNPDQCRKCGTLFTLTEQKK